MTEIEVVERLPAAVVGVPVIGTFTDLGRLVPGAWDRLREALAGTVPAPLAELSVDLGDGRYHETVGALVDLGADESLQLTGVVRSLVPGGRWARTSHQGPTHTIHETFGRLLHWAAERGERLGGCTLDVGYHGVDEPHQLALLLA